MATSVSRSLRVGVVLNGQLVEERMFDGATPVTFGQSLRCALSIPVEGAPREHVLFARDQGRFVLRTTRRMTGRLGSKDALTDIEGERELVLARGVRGKLTLGDATILFQEIATPPAAPRPQLPAAIRGTLADRIDRRLATILAGSLALHIGLATWAWMTDVETTTLGMSPIAQTYHHDVIDVTFPDVVTPAPPPANEPGIAKPVAPPRVARPIVTPTNITRPIEDPDANAQRLASILTGDQTETHGKGGMGSRQPGVDLDKQIAEVRDRNYKIGDGTQTSRVDDRSGIGTTPDRPLVNDPTLTQTPARPDEEPRGRIIPGDVIPDTRTTLTAAMVLDRIKTVYMSGLQRCYVLGLRDDGELSGRVKISFTVDERGKVIDPDAAGVSAKVDSCISNQMSTWRFAIPRDKDGDATNASFTVSLALQPS
jgi:hypothetical protein